MRILFLVLTLTSLTSFAEEDIYEINIKDHKFDPEITYVKPGVKIKLKINNLDESVEEFESIELKREKIIPSKSSAKIVLPPLEEGEYSFFGEFHPETAQGKIIARNKE